MMPQERQRTRDDTQAPGGAPPPPGGDTAGLAALRSAGQEFLAAGDAAIDRALSKGNSEAFLTANKQRGGQ